MMMQAEEEAHEEALIPTRSASTSRALDADWHGYVPAKERKFNDVIFAMLFSLTFIATLV